MNTLFHFRLFVIINIAIINSAAKVTKNFDSATTYVDIFSSNELSAWCCMVFFFAIFLLDSKFYAIFALILW